MAELKNTIINGSVRLNGSSSGWSYLDLDNKPTIPATNVIPVTTTANLILISTGTSGTAAWSTIKSTDLVTADNNFTTNQVLIADGNTKKTKTSGYTIGTSVPSDAVFTDRYVGSAALSFTQSTRSLGITLTRAGSDTIAITGTAVTLPLVTKDGPGLAPQGEVVSSQSSSTKFLREDGTWSAPSYTSLTSGYWADQSVSTSPSSTTTPTFGEVKLRIGSNNLTLKKTNTAADITLTFPHVTGTILASSNTTATGYMIPETTTVAGVVKFGGSTAFGKASSDIGHLKIVANGTVSVDKTVVTGSDLTNDTIIVGNNSSAIKTSSKTISTASLSSSSSDNTIPTSKAVWDTFSGLTGAMIYKGTVSSNGNLPTSGYKAGWLYKVTVGGTYAGKTCTIGDSLIANKDYVAGAVQNNDWDLLVDVAADMVGATAGGAGVHGLVPAPSAGKNLSFLRGDGTWVVPDNQTYGIFSNTVNGLVPAFSSENQDGTALISTDYVLDGNSKKWKKLPSTAYSSGVTSITIKTEKGLTGGSDTAATSTGTWTIGHSNTAVTAQTTQALYPVTFDAYGHILSSGTAVSSLKNPSSLVLKFDSGTTEGTNMYTYDGSATKTIDFKAGTNISLTKTSNTITIGVTGVSTADEKVKQTASTDNNFYPLLAKQSTGTTTVIEEARFGSTIGINPSLETIRTPNINTAAVQVSSTVGTINTNTCTMQYNATTQCLEFIFT